MVRIAGKTKLIIAFIVMSLLAINIAIAAPLTNGEIEELGNTIVFGSPGELVDATEKLVARGNKDVVAMLILASRYRGASQPIMSAINALTGQSLKGWHDAMLWQEEHPEIKPHSSFPSIKTRMFNRIDPLFDRFLGGERSKPENMKIRLEEIAWGGVVVDGIPSLDNPKLVDADAATYLIDSDLVFGVAINGDIRAYPLRIMGWHEMFNETIGGVPVALAYCTLCGAGILFETMIEGRDKPLVFGSSGFLYRSNKLMFDRETNSLWNQFTGEPVSGPLVNSGIQLKLRPVTITTWANWKKSNPKTKVLSLDTGHRRDYSSGNVYKDYFASPDLMFPAVVRNENQIKRKDFVFGIRDVGAAKAWPVTAFKNVSVINDQVGTLKVVLIGDAKSRTVRAYARGELKFTQSAKTDKISALGQDWVVLENELIGPDGTKLSRVPGHISYWFAWDGYLGVKSSLYGAE